MVVDQKRLFARDCTERSHRAFTRRQDAIDAEAATDGLSVIRTNLDAACLDDADTVRRYTRLKQCACATR